MNTSRRASIFELLGESFLFLMKNKMAAWKSARVCIIPAFLTAAATISAGVYFTQTVGNIAALIAQLGYVFFLLRESDQYHQ